MSFSLQQQIKNNSTDIKNYIDDLYKWEEQVTQKPKKNILVSQKSDIPPIRGAVETEKIVPKSETAKKEDSSVKKFKRDGNTVSDYYKAWDTYDIDKELEKLESDDKTNLNPNEKTQINNNNNTTPNKPLAPANTKMVIKGGRTTIHELDSLKDRANLCFRTFDYPKALELYSECIEKLDNLTQRDPIAYSTLLSNRAMTYIKLQDYVKAEADCEISIQLNPNFSKSYARRAACRKKLGKIKLALEDYKRALELESDNQNIMKEINLIEESLKARKIKAAKNLVLPYKMSNHKTVKVDVLDIGENEVSKKEYDDTKDNFLKMTFNVETKNEKKAGDVDSNSNETKESKNFLQKKENSIKGEESNIGFLNLKEIDRVSRNKPSENIKFDEIIRKKVKFGGENDIIFTSLKKKAYDPNNIPSKKIIKNLKKTNNDNNISNPKENDKVTIENVIKKGKIDIVEKILQETKETFNKGKLISSSQFLSNWKNVFNDKTSALDFLKVLKINT